MKKKLNINLMWYNLPETSSGAMAELADAYALGAYDFGHKSSTLFCPTKVGNNFGFKTSVDTGVLKKICCSACCIEEKMLQYRKGMYRELAASRSFASLRIYPPNSYIPTTAYFLAIPTSFF